MASFSLGVAAALDLAATGPGPTAVFALRIGGSLDLDPHDEPTGTFSLDTTANLLLTQNSEAGASFTLPVAVGLDLDQHLPVRGSFSLDAGGALVLHNDVGSSWSIDVENTGGGDDGIFPTLTLLISLTDPLAVPDWLSIPDRVIAFGPTRGRSGEFADFPAGTGSLTLDNRGGLFDRDNQASPLAPYLTTNRRIRVVATWDDIDYVMLDQFSDFFPMDDDPTFESRTVTVTTTDSTTFLADHDLQPARPFTLDDDDLGVLDDVNLLGGDPFFEQTLAGIRIREILEMLGWPEELMDIDDGLSLLADDAPTDKALVYMQRCARSDMGQLFVSASNVVTFRQRDAWSYITEQNTPQITFSDNDAYPGAPYTDIQIDPGSRALIKNRATRTATSGITFTAEDLDSEGTYGTLEDDQTDLLNANQADLVDQCEYVIDRYGDGVPRVTGLTADNVGRPDLFFPFALACEIGWRAIAVRTPALTAPPVPRDCQIEQITHAVTAPKLWQLTVGLVEADLTSYFTLDDDLLGQLDVDDVLAY